MSNVTLDQLTPDALAALTQQLKEQEAAKAQKTAEERKAYKQMVDEAIPGLYADAIAASAQLSAVKTRVFNELQSLIEMKAQVFGREGGQYSHSFTTSDGITLIMGHRFNDGWDDTVTAGMTKVTDYLQSLAKDKDSKVLVSSIMKLMAKDGKGNLKASRVLQLKKIADETGNAEFIDAVNIIQDAYRPVKTKAFVTIRHRSPETGEFVDLPLDITSAEFDFKMEADAKETDQAAA